MGERVRKIVPGPSGDGPATGDDRPQDHSHRDERRAVDMRGIATLQDGRKIPVVLLNLSYDGCAVESACALAEGSTLQLATRGGVVDAEVRWASGTQAGLHFRAEPLGPARRSAEPTPRDAERMSAGFSARMKRFGRNCYAVPVPDVSVSGCKVEFADRPHVGETVFIRFDGLDSIEATVRWVGDRDCGLDFVCPIHPAILELMLQRHHKAA